MVSFFAFVVSHFLLKERVHTTAVLVVDGRSLLSFVTFIEG